MTELIFEAVKKTGQRVLLSKGWGGMGADKLRIPEGVFILGNVPHDWLFKHVSCVVHHGGAGTTAAGIAAGRPTVVVPFFGDQPFWGAMVARAGAGPHPIPHKQLTADKLADAINFCLEPESLERAQELASRVTAEQGSDMCAQSFHQHLDADRLRCTLAPSRPATWRIRRTQVRLSAFAACTLANANLLDFHDLKLFRPQEYYTDEGPWDPVSGGAAACYRAFTGMAMGLAEFPSETLKTLHIPMRSSRQQSQQSLPTITSDGETLHAGQRSAPPTSPAQSRTSLNVEELLTRISSTSDDLKNQPSPKQDDTSPSRVRSQDESRSGKDPGPLRQNGAETTKGLGRFAKAFVQTPMEVSVSLTKGFHNMPKLWGDDTVRPQEQVSDFKSGAIAAGKEFGYGWYDGVTGLVTQPWKGAQKEGAGGFVKGVGKGVLGFAFKPFAGFSGILGHTMKGVQKEVQKALSSNVQNHIFASRVAQGYEEWLQSSDAEKQDVIDRWRLIQKYLKKKQGPDETMEDVLKAQWRQTVEDTTTRQNCEYRANPAQAASADSLTLELQSPILATGGSWGPEESLKRPGINDTMPPTVQETSREDLGEDANTERPLQESDQQAEQDNLRQGLAASEVEAQRHATEALEFKKQLEQVMAQSVLEQ
jgi:hypothetical protein